MRIAASALFLTLACGIAAADVTVTQGSSASTYDTTLNFDEPGQAIGALPSSYWVGSHGVDINAGDGAPFVGDFSIDVPWVNGGNAFFGAYGVFMTFESDLDSFSARAWDPSGPPDFFGGGFAVIALKNGIEVGSFFGEPAWGGLGNEWYEITATNGDTFDEVRMLGFGFFPTTYADDFSWHTVPAPASLGLFGLAAFGRRRRA